MKTYYFVSIMMVLNCTSFALGVGTTAAQLKRENPLKILALKNGNPKAFESRAISCNNTQIEIEPTVSGKHRNRKITGHNYFLIKNKKRVKLRFEEEAGCCGDKFWNEIAKLNENKDNACFADGGDKWKPGRIKKVDSDFEFTADGGDMPASDIPAPASSPSNSSAPGARG